MDIVDDTTNSTFSESLIITEISVSVESMSWNTNLQETKMGYAAAN